MNFLCIQPSSTAALESKSIKVGLCVSKHPRTLERVRPFVCTQLRWPQRQRPRAASACRGSLGRSRNHVPQKYSHNSALSIALYTSTNPTINPICKTYKQPPVHHHQLRWGRLCRHYETHQNNGVILPSRWLHKRLRKRSRSAKCYMYWFETRSSTGLVWVNVGGGHCYNTCYLMKKVQKNPSMHKILHSNHFAYSFLNEQILC